MSILELENVTKAFDGVLAVDKLSLGFDEAKITALIGPNGAGKTTIFNLICGLIRPDSGAISYRTKNITGLAPWHVAQQGIGRLFQDVRLFERLTVNDNILAAFKNQTGENAFLSVVVPWKVVREERSFLERALQLLEFVGLADKANDLAENLSYGQQKLLSIARLLALDADVLLIDEPTAGVNPTMVASLLEFIRRLAKEGKTIVVIEHNMNVVVEIADWVCFMNQGQVESFGLPNEVLGDPEVRAAYIGL
ncbi:ABC transporter ATP-binding protein [candidate division KSB1 bacterium]|nr:ABC transporter ATP-binding protein [candidate division KSB1 bacterium]